MNRQPIADWKHEELKRRKERLLNNPTSVRTWEEVKKRARLKHSRGI
jgi:hypothetical protein